MPSLGTRWYACSGTLFEHKRELARDAKQISRGSVHIRTPRRPRMNIWRPRRGLEALQNFEMKNEQNLFLFFKGVYL